MRWIDTSELSPRHAPCTTVLLVGTVVVYVLQAVLQMAGVDILTPLMGLSVGGLMQGHFWLLFTYLFLHGGPIHLIFNMFMLYMLGSEVERSLGRLHFLILYFLSGILGGLGWALLMWPYEGLCVGASGAIFGLLGAFAALYPQREVTMLLFLIFPLTMRAWVLATALAVVQLLMMMAPATGGIAYSAHLAGGLAGVVYVLVLFRRDVVSDWWAASQQGVRRRQQAKAQAADQALRAGVDRLLDKVAHQGLHSLTPAERAELERASTKLRGRS